MTKFIALAILSTLCLVRPQERDEFKRFENDLFTWMENNGAEFQDVELRESRENLMRGVYAKKDFKKGDQLIFVPLNALTERNRVFETSIGKKM